jgi:hypothetical protein
MSSFGLGVAVAAIGALESVDELVVEDDLLAPEAEPITPNMISTRTTVSILCLANQFLLVTSLMIDAPFY